jgi:thioredoxin reductase (NADPH)
MESIGADLRQMQRTPLAAPHVDALRAAGTVVTYPGGAFLARPGEPMNRFTYVEDGEIEVVDPYTDQRHLPSTLGPTQFMGEIAFLNGGAWTMAMRAVKATRVIEVPREVMLTLMSKIPEMSDIIITVFSARRRRQLEDRDGNLRLIGEEVDRSVRRIAEFASRNHIPYSSVPLASPQGGGHRVQLLPGQGTRRSDFWTKHRRFRSDAGQNRAVAGSQPRVSERGGI